MASHSVGIGGLFPRGIFPVQDVRDLKKHRDVTLKENKTVSYFLCALFPYSIYPGIYFLTMYHKSEV
jgi:hypothetical protein